MQNNQPFGSDFPYGPDDYWAARDNLIELNELSPDSPLFQPLGSARGSFNPEALYRALGIDSKAGKLRGSTRSQYYLFTGHIGSGKSTELRQISKAISGPEQFLVIMLDIGDQLDSNNLRYADVLIALAHQVLNILDEHQISLPAVFLQKLQDWSSSKIVDRIDQLDLSAELKTGLKAEPSIPFLGKLFAQLTTAIRNKVTYTESLRAEIINHFSEFAEAFNQLIQAAQEAIKTDGVGQALLFVIDGTDRLNEEDSVRFFLKDVHQLQQIRGSFIYSARIDMLFQHTQLDARFAQTIKLPMITLVSRQNERQDTAYDCLRRLVLRRISPALFDSMDDLDTLIEHSGGHPRDLIRLTNAAWQQAEDERLTQGSVQRGIAKEAASRGYVLLPDDFKQLVQIDRGQTPDSPEREADLLKNLVLLEYNGSGYWRRSHPLVRTLPGYTHAENELDA